MKTITFSSNLPMNGNSNNSKWNFDPTNFKGIPKSAGVYIVGIKKQVPGQGEVFCPLYVGIRDNLQSRIKGHWKLNGYLNGKKELFDLTLNMNNVYRDVENYNLKWINASKTIESKLALSKIDSLIWFNSPLFFDSYLGLPIGSSQYRDSNDWHKGTLDNDLTILGSKFPKKTKAIQQLKQKIVQTKELISENYFYAYYEHAFIGDYRDEVAELQRIEAATKFALEHHGIHTYGHISGSAKKSNADFSKDYLIDFSNISSCLFQSGKK